MRLRRWRLRVSQPQSGDRNSPVKSFVTFSAVAPGAHFQMAVCSRSQPRVLVSKGSVDMIILGLRPHFLHSNVRYSNPVGPASVFE
jgi:hypothetical protein